MAYNKPNNPGAGGGEMGAAKSVASGKVDCGTGKPHSSTSISPIGGKKSGNPKS